MGPKTVQRIHGNLQDQLHLKFDFVLKKKDFFLGVFEEGYFIMKV